MRTIICLFLIAASQYLLAQETYFKTISPFETSDRYPQSLLMDGDEFYISGKIICYEETDSFSCLAVSKHKASGVNIWEREFKWSNVANRNGIVLRNDSLFIGGHIAPGEHAQVFHLLILNTDGDSLLRRSFDFRGILAPGVYSNGIHVTGDYIFTYGMAADSITDEEVLPIHRYDLRTDTDTLILIDPERGKYFPGWEMEEDADGNLLVFNEVYNIEGAIGEQREVLKLDQNGKVLKRIYGPEPNSSTIEYEFVLMDDGTYTILNNVYNDDKTPRIINMDTTGHHNWEIAFPSTNGQDSVGVFNIFQMVQAANGDLIIAGNRNRKKKLGKGFDIFLMRATSSGEVLWQKTYNTPVDLSEREYHYYVPTDAKECADGGILVMGVAYHHGDIVLLKVDENGCSEQFGCGESILLSSEEVPYAAAQLSIAPNPSQGRFTIQLERSMTGQMLLYNIKGQRVDQMEFKGKNEIEYDNPMLRQGMYHVVIKTKDEVKKGKVLILE